MDTKRTVYLPSAPIAEWRHSHEWEPGTQALHDAVFAIAAAYSEADNAQARAKRHGDIAAANALQGVCDAIYAAWASAERQLYDLWVARMIAECAREASHIASLAGEVGDND